MRSTTWSGMICAALAFVNACVTAGRPFQHPRAAWLDLGVTTEADVTAAFGRPEIANEVKRDSERFRILTCTHVEGSLFDVKAKRLELEFRKGLLNAYIFVSLSPDGGSAIPLEAIYALEPENVFFDEVTASVREPTGQGRCPSALMQCDPRGVQVLAWSEVSMGGVFAAEQVSVRAAFAAFDELGVYVGCGTLDTGSEHQIIQESRCQLDKQPSVVRLCMPEEEIRRSLYVNDAQLGPTLAASYPEGTHLCAIGDLSDCGRQCSAGHLDSCTRLGTMHLLGLCVESASAETALAVYEQACRDGGITACRALGT